MTTQCIAHQALVTGYDGKPRDFAHCGVCRQRMDRDFTADQMRPRGTKGQQLSTSSKGYQYFKTEFIRHLEAQVAHAVIEQQTGMTPADAAREYPYAYSSFGIDRCLP